MPSNGNMLIVELVRAIVVKLFWLLTSIKLYLSDVRKNRGPYDDPIDRALKSLESRLMNLRFFCSDQSINDRDIFALKRNAGHTSPF